MNPNRAYTSTKKTNIKIDYKPKCITVKLLEVSTGRKI